MASTTTVHATTFWNRWHHNDTTTTTSSGGEHEHGDDNEPRRTLKHHQKKTSSRAARSRTRTQSVETVQSLPSREDWVSRKEEQAPPQERDLNQVELNSGNHEQNLMQWLETKCPGDCLPKVLAFCGPQQTAALSRTNKHWNEVIRAESTWRVLCEELYKVRVC